MKTEGLSLVEAWQAVWGNKVVANTQGNKFRLYANKPEFWDYLRSDPLWTPSSFNGFTADHEPFSIVPDPSIPEPKSLTAAEAVDLLEADKKIKIRNAATSSNVLELGSSFDQEKRFNELILYTNYLDLAERKGWPIHAVES